MRILLGVHQFFPKYYAGTERYVLNLARQFQRFGHQVKVLTYAFNEDGHFQKGYSPKMYRKEYSYKGVPVVALKHAHQPDDHRFLFNFFDDEIYREVKMMLERDDPYDIFHCAHPFRIASSVPAARETGCKVIAMITDYFLMCPHGIMLRLDNTLCTGPEEGRNCRKYCFSRVTAHTWQKRMTQVRDLAGLCDCMLSPSRFLIGLFDYSGVIPASHFALSRHGFDYALKQNWVLKEPGKTITFGYIGTIQYHKGVHIMLEGFSKCSAPQIRLQVWGGCYGDEGYQKRITKMAKKDPRIEIKGPYDYEQIGETLREIDAVVVPSIWYENAPLTILSALAFGIPVITSDIGGMREMVEDGKNGFIFRVGSPDSLAEKMKLIAEEPGVLSSMRKTAGFPIRIEEEALNAELVFRGLLQ